MSNKYMLQTEYKRLVENHNYKSQQLAKKIQPILKNIEKSEDPVILREERYKLYQLQPELNELKQSARYIINGKNPTWKRALDSPRVPISEAPFKDIEPESYDFTNLLSVTEYNNFKKELESNELQNLKETINQLNLDYEKAQSFGDVQKYRKDEHRLIKNVQHANRIIYQLNNNKPIGNVDPIIEGYAFAKKPRHRHEPRINVPWWAIAIVIIIFTSLGLILAFEKLFLYTPNLKKSLKITFLTLITVALLTTLGIFFYQSNNCDGKNSNVLCTEYNEFYKANKEYEKVVAEAEKIGVTATAAIEQDEYNEYSYNFSSNILGNITNGSVIPQITSDTTKIEIAIEEELAGQKAAEEAAKKKAEEQAAKEAEEKAAKEVEEQAKQESSSGGSSSNGGSSSSGGSTAVTTVVDPCDTSGHREPNAVVDIGYDSSYANRDYYAYTNSSGQLTSVYAPELIIQSDSSEDVNSSGRYCNDEAKVLGTESETYDEGHIIADSLGGVSNAYNITPQEYHLNRWGEQSEMEEALRSTLSSGNSVTNFNATITYPNSSTQTPSSYSYSYEINGQYHSTSFSNSNTTAYAYSREEELMVII